jgi:hypothetical protein
MLGTDLRGDLGVHELGDHPGHRLADDIGVLAGEQLVGKWAAVILWPSAIVVFSFVDLVEQTDDSRTPRWPNSHPASRRCYTTICDSTMEPSDR